MLKQLHKSIPFLFLFGFFVLAFQKSEADIVLSGQFIGSSRAGGPQTLIIKPYNELSIYDPGGTSRKYYEKISVTHSLDGWVDSEDIFPLVGDFMGLGHDQVLFINRRDQGDGKIQIVDYSSGRSQIKYWENWGDSDHLDGWIDNGDRQLAGDFLKLGHSQVLYINRQDLRDGKIQIVDYSKGTHEQKYWENWGDSDLLDNWLDEEDQQRSGNVLNLGYSQMMFFNRRPAGDGKIMIVDYSTGVPSKKYWENWGDYILGVPFNAKWVGDPWNLGHDIVLYYGYSSQYLKKWIDYSSGAPVVLRSESSPIPF